MTDPVLFTLAVLAVLGTPGPTNTLLATGGALVGFRRALRLVAAETTGYLVAILTLGLVLGSVVSATPALGVALRAAVGLYLFVLAVRLWSGSGMSLTAKVVTPVQVFLTTLLNPKAIVFAPWDHPIRQRTHITLYARLSFSADLCRHGLDRGRCYFRGYR